jgi:hypothetical protein
MCCTALLKIARSLGAMNDVVLPEVVEIPADRIFTKTEPVPEPVATYTVSARNKPAHLPVLSFLRKNYGNLPLNEIDSLFGFVEKSSLYGGRIFENRELSNRDVQQLNNADIGVRIPMSNHYVIREEYLNNKSLLRKYHRAGNSIICTNDDLAMWIRDDFPDYRIDASVIKNLKTHGKIEAAMKLYDSVVLPMKLNEDIEFLKKIENKDKVTLFANAGCALTCPSHLCYASVSKINKGQDCEWMCSLLIKDRTIHGMVDFPLQPYIDIGIKRFKLLRARKDFLTGF